jgi:hypothetical protein
MVLVAAALAAVAAGAAPWGFHAWRSHADALFEGPEVHAPEVDLPWVPGVIYTFTDWLIESDNAPWKHDALQPRTAPDPTAYIDGAGRQRFEVLMSRTRDVDTVTGASRIVRLLSPTVHQERTRPRFLPLTARGDRAVVHDSGNQRLVKLSLR